MRLKTILHLGVKELRGLLRDPMLAGLIVYAFTLSIYTSANAVPETLNKATIAIVDEDRSPVVQRVSEAFYLPYFSAPRQITREEMDARMDAGKDTFALNFPPNFQADLLAGRQPVVQLNVDATRMAQAFSGAGYIQNIVYTEITAFLARSQQSAASQVALTMRARFNPSMNQTWFGAISNVIMAVTMLSIILTGAALIREREHGTVEHLLVMPVTAAEIMVSKVWSMGLVVLAATAFSLSVVVQGMLQVPIPGSLSLFLMGAALHLFATTSMGIFLATLTGSMPQFGLLLMLVLLPLQVLSGSVTPRESMPEIIQFIMLAAPNTHFGILAEAVLFRGAGMAVVWPQLLALLVIGSLLFMFALNRFRDFLR
ncbi:ABC transporter permease [Thalassovita taeanensis]|uniref:ABC-2 type transport system permease protein n=1 Tax=Thalassovita taeanensis TaxID=657014 RepID=A0A1H9CBN6_9RHOB|nr:ABC transporter permease [Thalassovita taeanensis]SEP98640.1 ABC-2 type transport system permease protein [Thalassovita taeanensis]